VEGSVSIEACATLGMDWAVRSGEEKQQLLLWVEKRSHKASLSIQFMIFNIQ